MARRAPVGLLLAVTVLLGASVAQGDTGGDQARLQSRIDALQARVAAQDRRAQVLTGEVSAAAARVRTLQAGVATQEARLARLEAALASARARLAAEQRTVAVQDARLARLRVALAAANARLEAHVRAVYVSDDPDLVATLLGTTSVSDLLDRLELLDRIGAQDDRVVTRVKAARAGVADARRRSVVAAHAAARIARSLAEDASSQRAVVAQLASQRDALVGAQADRRATLASIGGDRAATLAEIDGLEAQSAALAATIRARQSVPAASPPAPQAGGSATLRWPVSGPVTSGFGMRWGRMHDGVDIGVPVGTPVVAAASGVVIYAGWMSGYGNLVVLDHGSGLSTAYGHNSTLLVAVGQSVSGGSTIARSGNTGHSTGPHVHFEVRVGGAPVDPLRYL